MGKLAVARLLPWLIAGVASALVATSSESASACINGVEDEVDPRREALYGAENALRSDQLLLAASLAHSVTAKVRTAEHKPGMVSRAKRVMALVVIRSGGKWLVGNRLSVVDEKQRADNVAWAITVLRERVMQQLNHLDRLADLGEALASVSAHRDEATRILEHLAARDLMTSAHGWAALSRLRRALGDGSGANLAQAKCRTRTKISRICRVDGAAST